MKTLTTPPTPGRLPSPLRLASVTVVSFLIWLAIMSFLRSPEASAQSSTRYYPQTGYSISGPFLTFFDQFGGLKIFGYPISGVVQENGRSVQYFERQRFEYHSEYAGTDYEVELSRLGQDLMPSSASSVAANAQGQPGRLLIPQTGHTLGAPFLAYWKVNGAIRVFGYPISEVVNENGLQVQYFERARMEYHPEKEALGYGVELGLLGHQLLVSKSAPDNSRAVSPTSRGSITTDQPPAGTSNSPALSAGENRLWTLINNARQQAGAGQVALDPTLRGIALSRSQDMVARNYFSHTTPDGVDFLTLLKNAQVSYKFAGEIITNNNFDQSQAADQAFNSFMNSAHHHDIMLDPRYTVAGVGQAINGKGYSYFTVIFVQK